MKSFVKLHNCCAFLTHFSNFNAFITLATMSLPLSPRITFVLLSDWPRALCINYAVNTIPLAFIIHSFLACRRTVFKTSFKLITLFTVNYSFQWVSAFTAAPCILEGCLDRESAMPIVLPAACTTSNWNGSSLSTHLVNLLEKVLFPRFGFNTELRTL